jgi:hypothetical protein
MLGRIKRCEQSLNPPMEGSYLLRTVLKPMVSIESTNWTAAEVVTKFTGKDRAAGIKREEFPSWEIAIPNF